MLDSIAVLIPCFNEAKTIEKVVTDFRRVLPEAVVYVYDNNSTDGTGAIAAAAGAVVRKEPLQGKGNVVRRMFQDIDASCYIIVDGDDTYPAEAAREMTAAVLSGGADMVIGDRLSSTYFTENKRPFHNFGNSLVRRTINAIFGTELKDIMTGYRAFSYRFVKSFPVLSKGFEIETEMTIHAIDRNMVVTNQVVTYRDRPAGSESKLNTFRDGARVLKTIVNLFCDYRPFTFFSWLGAGLEVVALGFFLPVLKDYLATGLVARFPTLIVCGFLVIAGLQLFSVGLVLHMIRRKDKRDFELELYRVMDRYREMRGLGG